ncbi:MAG: aminotransferase class I/II-fold pyridoxal phosphate-dependent enzyme [Actinobacteria bacterium]|nr:aminotransferase class I/II-fold pyridoxal phosphate-dependent enzyme [Actinomycetota bacterium]
MGLTLVVGGIRSGKSGYAERLAEAAGPPVVYVATGAGDDAEMAERIERHRRRRPSAWQTLEAADPLGALGADLAGAPGATVLIDGLGGWICALMQANCLFTDEAVAPWGEAGEAARRRVLAAVSSFAGAAASREAATIVVADEAGLGGVPPGAGSRRFLDLSGEATQLLASSANAVWLVVAGQAVPLKAPNPPAPEPERPDLRVHGDSQVPPGALDFAVNVVPGGPPPQVRERLASALSTIDRYPDDAPAASAVAARHGRPPDEALVLNGAAEAFWLLAHALRPRRAVCVHPSFTEPEAALRAAGAEVVRAQRDPEDFSLDPAAIDPAAGFVVIGNPNNPTGNLDPAATIAGLARPGRILVVDEAFMDLVPGEGESLARRGDIPGLVVVRSLTKAWALPGLRAGFLLAPAGIVAALCAARQPWSVNNLALAALEAYGRGELTAAAVAGETALAREELATRLRCLPGVRVWPSCANFLLVRVSGGEHVRAGLLERGIAVRRAATFPGLTADHLRIAVRTPADNERLLAALAEVV